MLVNVLTIWGNDLFSGPRPPPLVCLSIQMYMVHWRHRLLYLLGNPGFALPLGRRPTCLNNYPWTLLLSGLWIGLSSGLLGRPQRDIRATKHRQTVYSPGCCLVRSVWCVSVSRWAMAALREEDTTRLSLLRISLFLGLVVLGLRLTPALENWSHSCTALYYSPHCLQLS